MFRRRFLFLLGLLGGFANHRSIAWGRPLLVRTGSWLEVKQLKGKAIYQTTNRRRWKAWVGLRFQSVGEVFETAADSTVVMNLESGIGTIFVAERTKFSIKQRYTTKDGGQVMQLYVERGQIRLKVRPLTNSNSRLEIMTPAGIAGVRGTEFGVGIQPNGQSGVATPIGPGRGDRPRSNHQCGRATTNLNCPPIPTHGGGTTKRRYGSILNTRKTRRSNSPFNWQN
ncbi:MAG: hypothetical protein HC805_00725 [Alkalinema sp. RL_2_19]|nr:hypothetical protein [Alkalinema sp. RL_2_19]